MKQMFKVFSELYVEGDQFFFSFSIKQDDILVDVDLLEIFVEIFVKVEKEGIELEMMKLEVERLVDDNVCVDDVLKCVINDDIDNEVDDLKLEEVIQMKESNNNMEEIVQREFFEI